MNRHPLRPWRSPLAAIARLATPGLLLGLLPGLLLAGCGNRSTRAAAAASTWPAAAADRPAPFLKPSRPQDGGPGLKLLEQAAQAGSDISYQGVEMVSSTGVNGDSTMVANVWHRSGGDTLVQVASSGAAGPSSPVSFSDDPDSSAPEGVLGLTGQLVALLGSNYDLAYMGRSTADNRPALLVEAVREDGSLAARFWLDSATKLPLRREVFGPDAHLIGEGVFVDLTLGSAAAAPPSGTPARPAQQLTAVDVTTLRAHGWPAPDAMPGGLTLFESGEASTRSGTVLDLGYSDGLFVVSVFVQRGDLAPSLSGYQKITLDGRDVYAGQPDPRSVTWAGHGFVFTVMADAPAATVDQVVDTLPYDAPPGFWGRLSKGFGRLAALANPFR